MAAAEDFDPLRIRPYVTLPGNGDGTGHGTGDATAVLPPVAPPPAPPAPPVAPGPLAGPLPPEAVPPATPAPQAPLPEAGAGAGSGGGPETMRLLLPGTAPDLAYEGGIPYGYEPEPGYEPGYPDEGPAHTLAYAPEGRDGHGRGRGRARTAMIAGVVAAAVVGTAALAAALIGGGDETDDRAGVPEVTTSASDNVAVSEAPTPTPSESASTSATPSPTRTGTGSPSPAATRATPTATAPAAPPRTASATPARPSATASADGTTLRLGSTGDDVRDLQRRLRQLGLYSGRIDGTYGRKVEHAVEVFQSYMYIEEDPRGVYGPTTRRALENATNDRDGGSGGGDGWN
ncbi:peptidoglycan-binding protein [Streptomyces fradiae]|uniref:peptidoglycan-binding domain-containing protein n=1 Tax=Streptomyces fradiae TaxID=1906 RepID=UPI0035151AC8